MRKHDDTHSLAVADGAQRAPSVARRWPYVLGVLLVPILFAVRAWAQHVGAPAPMLAAVESESPWLIHIIFVPLVLLVGLVIGYQLRDARARREAGAPPGGGSDLDRL